MKQFQLHVFFQIIGIGSASGLLYHNNLLYIISDNSTYLYAYNLDSKSVVKIPLVKNPKENILKKEKLDFESIHLHQNKLHIFSSASTKNRNSVITYSLEDNTIDTYDQSSNYRMLERLFGFKLHQLNIEGVINHQDFVYLFQRGNGLDNKNGIFKIHNFGKTKPEFFEIKLPHIQNIEATFTDAILLQDTIYFLAAVENTDSTYNDGEILGTFVGSMKINDFSELKTVLISETNKFEGITFYKQTAESIEFLLCEDNDTEDLNSNIYKLQIKK